MAGELMHMQIVGAVAIYCIVQSIRDVRGRHYGWAAAAAICVIALLLAPLPTHAVKLDLPVDNASR